MDEAQRARVATLTLRSAEFWRDGVFGRAIRFGDYSRATAYGFRPLDGQPIDELLAALRNQLAELLKGWEIHPGGRNGLKGSGSGIRTSGISGSRSEEHTSELQSLRHLV